VKLNNGVMMLKIQLCFKGINDLKRYSTFLEIGSFYNSLRVKQCYRLTCQWDQKLSGY